MDSLNTLNNKLSKSGYRPDIDGLRAIAIIAVIINHTDRSVLPGGYLGVDIFFVISGFVITLSLAERKSKSFISFFTGFFERRLKRLFPALIVFCVITALLIPLFDPTPGTSLRTAITGLFGFSNIYLLNNASDYFAPSTEFNPFSHTWSLDVEEQFYIIFPILIWFSGFGSHQSKGARNLLYTIIFLSTLSLFGYLYIFQLNRSAAYYLMPTRFWEMASGCLIYLVLNKKNWLISKLKLISPDLYFVAMIGVLFIPERYNFQGTILVVLTSALLLLTIDKEALIYKLLTHKIFIHFGLISYSLYLWHWGILSLSRWTIGIHWWSIPILMIIIYLLSYLSYKFIELPIQNLNNVKSWPTIFLALLSLISSNTIILSYGLFQREQRVFLGQKSNVHTNPNVHPFIPETNIREKNCLLHKNINIALENCKIDKYPKANTIYFVGDSINESLTQAAWVVSNKLEKNIFIHSRQGTLFPVNSYYLKGDFIKGIGKNIREKNDGFQNQFKKFLLSNLRKNDFVVITNDYPTIFTNMGGLASQNIMFFDYSGNQINNQKEFFFNWLLNLEILIKTLQEKKVNLILSSPGPSFIDIPNGDIVCKKEWFRLEECKRNRKDFLEEGGLYSGINSELINLSRKYKNVYFLDIFKSVCPSNQCTYTKNGISLFRDASHYSNYTSREIIGPELIKLIQSIEK